ncbi:acyl-CoA thioester hydrolase/BAAT C-terminal domain-containing protein [Kitasatospora sp. NPDC092948]|uniref:acyl-CoA thioester hydrolase/BAAT C-terminal domain-containing protein n=1 Tax=Kitasatospora sp. NPDC092948 TaxID=3364088 RepID=UPI00382A08DE
MHTEGDRSESKFGLEACMERELTEPWEGVLCTPEAGSGAGVLVLSGSSGRVERVRARLLAEAGLTALAIRWFGGPGQPPGVCEVPLETFTAAVDLLRQNGVRRIGMLGTSKGAEAAMLTAVHDPRVDAVVALSPTSLVWNNVGPGLDGADRPQRSCWTWRGQPLPFVGMDDTWTQSEPEGEPVAIRDWYEQSEKTFADLVPAAAVPVERTRADLLLVAGGDDAMWPSVPFARRLAERRREAGLDVQVVERADAGHRIRFPGEGPAPASTVFDYGGTPEADERLGAEAWPHIVQLLRGRPAVS